MYTFQLLFCSFCNIISLLVWTKQAKLGTMLTSIWPHFLEEKICQKLQKCHPKGHLKIFSAKPDKKIVHMRIWSNMMVTIFFLFFSDSWQPISMWLPSFGFHALVAKIWSSKTSGTSLQGTCQVSAFRYIMTLWRHCI